MIKLGFAALLLFNLNTSWALETLLFGGGGEPVGDHTIFDAGLEELAKNKDRVDLNIRSNFNGGHAKTEALLKDQLKVDNQDFTSDNWIKSINEYAAKIKNGQIKSGEKLLVLMDTHGEEADSQNSTHVIDLAIRGKVPRARQGSMDSLKELAKIANEKGVHLGIVDFSCHSGNSLSLGNENTCVVTAAGPNLFGYDDFTKNFYANMNKGMSLEEVFLKARKEAYSPSYPMISTKENEELKNNLYEKMYPYMTYAGGIANKLTPYLNKLVESPELQCKREADFNSLLKQIAEFEKVNGAIISRYSGNDELLAELKKYKAKQDEMLSEMKRLNFKLLATKEKIIIKSKSKKVPVVTWEEALRYSDSNLDYFKDQLKSSTGAERIELNETIARMTATKKIKERLLVEHPELVEASNFHKHLSERRDELMGMATKVHELASRLYDETYRANRALNDRKDACKSFVF